MIFPKIVLINPYFLGDTVLLEPIAAELAESSGREVYVQSHYPELFRGHTNLIGLSFNDEHPPGAIAIDLGQVISNTIKDKNTGDLLLLPDKLDKMWKAAGFSSRKHRAPNLHLSSLENNRREELMGLLPGYRVGIAPISRNSLKNWGAIEDVFEKLEANPDIKVFIFSEEYTRKPKFLDKYPVYYVCGKNIREMMVYISIMDQVFGIDTGVLHVAGALKRPITVVGHEIFAHLYDDYPEAKYFSTKNKNLNKIKPKKVINRICGFFLNYSPPKESAIPVIMLEGLGGTVTLSDHAAKLYREKGLKTHAVVRNYKEIFLKNPYIEGVTEVGHVPITEVIRDYNTTGKEFIAIKTGIGMWYPGDKAKLGRLHPELYDKYMRYPKMLHSVEKYELNMTQLANMALGLPYDEIETKVFYMEDPGFDLPPYYILVNNGVDVWHEGIRQTKSWKHEYWEELVNMLNWQVVQVGTKYDKRIKGVLDYRGETSIPQLLWMIKNASGVICAEGGIMHLAKAVGQQNTFVMRGPTAGHFYGYQDQYQIDSPVCESCYWETMEWYKECPKKLGFLCMDMIKPITVANAVGGRLNAKDMVKDLERPEIELGVRLARYQEIPAGTSD